MCNCNNGGQCKCGSSNGGNSCNSINAKSIKDYRDLEWERINKGRN